ncbi:alpha/beta hydrolase [Nonomuraea longicatena]|uniref:Peptidase S33 tripeptidyl aminopeptidase-like C-terminal domain-containing protein n=1 Tax=Nonomuraea longicatena TaxID=83682 RepID=A0ABN1QGU9_9ACTN
MASYAGTYGQTYARLYPGRVRTLALDGSGSHVATGEWERLQLADAKANESLFRRFLDWCEKDAACSRIGSDPTRVWQTLVAKAERNPIPAPTAGVHYDGRDLRGHALGMVYRGPAEWVKLGQAIKKAQAGDASGFASAGARLPYIGVPTGFTECLDFPRPASAAEVESMRARSRKVAPNTGEPFTYVAMLGCVGWPLPVTNPPKPMPKGLPPFLGAGAWRESDLVKPVLAQVPGSGLIAHDGPGHTLYLDNECARAHMNRYFTDRVVPRNAAC